MATFPISRLIRDDSLGSERLEHFYRGIANTLCDTFIGDERYDLKYYFMRILVAYLALFDDVSRLRSDGEVVFCQPRRADQDGAEEPSFWRMIYSSPGTVITYSRIANVNVLATSHLILMLVRGLAFASWLIRPVPTWAPIPDVARVSKTFIIQLVAPRSRDVRGRKEAGHDRRPRRDRHK